MDAKELKERLSEYDIKIILQSLGGEIWGEDEESIILNTICHGGDSPNKLVYYKESKQFYCYTHCGTTDILAIVSEVKDINLPSSIDYICTLLGISKIKYGFTDERIELIEDWSFINSFNKHRNKMLNQNKKTTINYPISTLNIFQNLYTTEWLNDGISKKTMEHFNIKYSTLQHRIIIPHLDIDGNLVGIRGRAMLEYDINNFGKYTPFSIHGTMYNHPLGQNLYGIYENKETIKKYKKVLLVESEKGVLQAATMFGVNNNFTVALCGCAKISNTQINILLNLGVEEIIIGLDRQYEEVDNDEYIKWQKHMKDKIINPLLPYFKVEVLWDTKGLLGYKESPTDRGKDVLLELMKNKIYVSA